MKYARFIALALVASASQSEVITYTMSGQVMMYEDRDFLTIPDIQYYEFVMRANTDHVILGDDGRYYVDVVTRYTMDDGQGMRDMPYDLRLILDPTGQTLHLVDQHRDAEMFAMQYVRAFEDYDLSSEMDAIFNLMLAYDNDLDFMLDFFDGRDERSGYAYVQTVLFSASVPAPGALGVLAAGGLIAGRRRR